MSRFKLRIASLLRRKRLKPRLRMPWMTWQETLRLRQSLLPKLRRAKT